MKVENARWNKGKYKCEHYRIQASNSVKALREMQAGEVKRIIHDDVSCKDCGKICTIVANCCAAWTAAITPRLCASRMTGLSAALIASAIWLVHCSKFGSAQFSCSTRAGRGELWLPSGFANDRARNCRGRG